MDASRELYERRVHEIMEKYLKNIKECDQDRYKKTPWDSDKSLDKGTPLDKNDDVRNIFEPR